MVLYHNLDRVANLLYFTDEIVPWIVKPPQSTTMQLTIILCVVCFRRVCVRDGGGANKNRRKQFRMKNIVRSDCIGHISHSSLRFNGYGIEWTTHHCSKSEINCILMI